MDRTVAFPLVAGDRPLPPPPTSLPALVHFEQAFDDELADVRGSVLAAKDALDGLDELAYRRARDRAFPLAVSGAAATRGERFMNRAGFKLLEVLDAAGIWDGFMHASRSGRRSIAFVDLCGGPGSFAQAVIGKYPRRAPCKLTGFGMTLKDAHKGAPEGWYPDLLKNERFHVTFGPCGTGDIYKMQNLHALASLTAGSELLLAVADGGFEVPREQSNWQESLSTRIAFGQWHAAVTVLRTGGALVLKLFDTFSPAMRSLLYLSAKLFDRAYIVKPLHSRAVNSERYLACRGFRGLPDDWRLYLARLHVEGFGPTTAPASLVPPEWLQEEGAGPAIASMNTLIAENQVAALKRVVEVAGEMAAAADIAEAEAPVAAEGVEGTAEAEDAPQEAVDVDAADNDNCDNS